MGKFFSEEIRISKLNKFNNIIKGLNTDLHFEKERNKSILIIVKYLIKKPDFWDLNCSFNISVLGDRMFEYIQGITISSTKEDIDYISSLLFRFLMEAFISIDEEFNDELLNARDVFIININHFSGSAQDMINYANRNMIISIFKKAFNGEDFKNIKDISSLIAKKDELEFEWEKKLSSKEEFWEKEISDREKRVNQIKESLDRYKTAFNFVGLHDGFHDLLEDKKNDLKSLLNWLKLSVFFIILPIMFELIFIVSHFSNIAIYREVILFSLMPILSLVIIATYFFRVLLSNYKSVKSQIMQIELRMTLCRFIQSYADYSAELKGKNETTLNKFEEIIFSNILSADGVALSAFDGMEKFSGLINSSKNKS